jgi:hypothetical protein
MGQKIRIVEEEIASLFSDHPLSFLNERDVVSEFHRRLLTQYPETVTLTVRTLSERSRRFMRRSSLLNASIRKLVRKGWGEGSGLISPFSEAERQN